MIIDYRSDWHGKNLTVDSTFFRALLWLCGSRRDLIICCPQRLTGTNDSQNMDTSTTTGQICSALIIKRSFDAKKSRLFTPCGQSSRDGLYAMYVLVFLVSTTYLSSSPWGSCRLMQLCSNHARGFIICSDLPAPSTWSLKTISETSAGPQLLEVQGCWVWEVICMERCHCSKVHYYLMFLFWEDPGFANCIQMGPFLTSYSR